MIENLLILFLVIIIGLIYYRLSTSKINPLKNQAFFMKISLLALSFLLTFVEQDFIVVGILAFGGKMPVMLLILIELIDAFVERKGDV